MTGRGAAGARGKTPSSPLSNNSSQNPIRKTYEEYYNEAGQKIKNVETANTLIEKNNLFTSGPDDEIDESYHPAAAPSGSRRACEPKEKTNSRKKSGQWRIISQTFLPVKL